MAGPLKPPSEDQLVAEYTKDEVNSWFSHLIDSLISMNNAMPFVLAVIGFIIMVTGFYVYARDKKAESGFGGQGGSGKGLWMIVCGGLLGASVSAYIFLIAVITPDTYIAP